MGDKNVSTETDGEQLRDFTRSVLNDLKALEKMLAGDYFEQNARRIGAEQEMFVVDSAFHPAPRALDIIETAGDERLTTELGLFNLEANAPPLEFSGDCLSRLEENLSDAVAVARRAARKKDADVILAGILPTIQQSDLVRKNLTPEARYEEMDRVLTELHGERRQIQMRGVDELQLEVEGVYVEFANMSFQVHLQSGIGEFVRDYNWSQAIAAPVLAAAVNSPVLLGRRLWHETRIALFQHATDARSTALKARDLTPRVHFGSDWMSDKIIDFFNEDVARFRFILTTETDEDSLAVLESGDIPKLSAWQMHNGSIWRWNRACYGVFDQKPGLRIEARYLPAGPTVADETANAAFFLGLMNALPDEFGDARGKFSFDTVKKNFFDVARNGLNTQIEWFDGEVLAADKLILQKLLPLADTGLKKAEVSDKDREKYLGILRERVAAKCTGAQWILDSYAAFDEDAPPNVKLRTIAAAMKENQETNQPVHLWKLAQIEKGVEWIDNFRTVERFMTRDLFTVRQEDAIDLAINLLEWKQIQHVPVEDDAGNLVGLISYRDLLAHFADSAKTEEKKSARDIMQTDLITIEPTTETLDALRIMREKNIGCLPVVAVGKLVGLLTTHDFLSVSTKLFEERLRELND